MTQFSLIANDKNNVDLILKPIKDGDQVTETTILELIEQSEYSRLHINIANIKNAISELNDVLKPLQSGKFGREITYQVLERIDATISVSIDSDQMAASAEITTAQGGKNLSAKAILEAAQASGVNKGFSKEQLVKLAQLAAKEKPLSLVSLQIATGKQAIKGKDAVIKPLVESAQSRILRPKQRNDGSVDMRDLGDIICVKVGEPLAEKIPHTLGENGYTVTAAPLIAEPGNDITLVAGDGTEISSTNKNILVSQRVGLPKMIPNGMEVDEVYRVKNVTVGSGNINFTGGVIIEGDVNEGMKVIASGDITVGGCVESAMIESGGDVTISGGIIGHKHDVEATKITDVKMSVSVNSKGNLYAKYCQYAQISCSKDIRIEKQLLHSLINVNGNLKVGSEDHANGVLIGGYIKAGKNVSAGSIGATAGNNTIISFENIINKLNDKMQDIESRLQFENDKTTELKTASDKLKQLPKSPANTEMLSKVISTYQFHAKRMGEILFEKEEHENIVQAYMESVSIEATDKLYHGVQFILGDINDRTRKEYGPSKMNYKDRKIHIDPIVNT
ncbi:FapA family protein [Colwellia sp. 1_MG-2023]|uniref:DUF342 domain-containing protein n=1 Tax=unclassified Colwellia TaxID=196834 RepID=UPI001C093C8B|nr:MULTISPECIES: FapA family protein [unclassified Colwellia]MBU2926422.1 FapA family protein [Colwellia sp. C2M11]MDO6651860.1 FapA family protein [Colwellia sp. 3_MG-2023]MDO6665229.1 FapA family protein [Colwellia sp. 2_MG-2023]MDO6689602.1 FapA family protein [Colwellia sp. 1_MG-2023]